MPRLFVLALAWLAWSGHYTYSLHHPLIAIFGAISCGAVWLLARRMDDSHPFAQQGTIGLRVLGYLPWLLWEIVKANIAVIKIILDPKLPISPRVIRVRASQVGEAAKVLYANSITLTPGTITLDVRGNYMHIHAIDRAAAEGVESGDMDRRVSALERDD